MFEMTNAKRPLNSPLETIQLQGTLTNLSWTSERKRTNLEFLISFVIHRNYSCSARRTFTNEMEEEKKQSLCFS